MLYKTTRIMLTSTVLLVLFTIQCTLDTAICVKIVKLEIPPVAVVGAEATLSCLYQLGDDNLYSIKWYKDGREFYRYMPSHLIRGMASAYRQFETPGFTVDVLRSSARMVSLVNLTSQATGAYRCEVSGEAPLFTTDTADGFMSVILAPDNPPEITGLRSHYKVGERLTARCSIYGTQPEITLKWLLNEQPVDKLYFKGPFKRVSALKPNATDTAIQLSFLLLNYDFVDGILTVKCVASLSTAYEKETIKMTELISEQNDIDFVEKDDIQPTTKTLHINQGIARVIGFTPMNFLLILILLKLLAE